MDDFSQGDKKDIGIPLGFLNDREKVYRRGRESDFGRVVGRGYRARMEAPEVSPLCRLHGHGPHLRRCVLTLRAAGCCLCWWCC